ncbi:MAG: aminopeptidase [Longicatena sp.]
MENFNHEFLRALSNADAIAANELEIRNVLTKELKEYADEISYDKMGSIIFTKKGSKKGPRIMICAHMDEVGFIVNNISPLGQIIVTEIGRVKPLAQFMQKVRITTDEGNKIEGIVQSTLGADASAEETYVDIGAYTREDVENLGIQIGDMVTYTTEYQTMDLQNLILGKAFDDRLGCYVIGEVLKRLKTIDHPNDVFIVGTSSEEVGTRGAKTSTYHVNPDIVIVIDVSCGKNEFDRGYKNRRQIGHGMMLMYHDRTLVPNKKLVRTVKESIVSLEKEVQYDMFVRGATDGAETHKNKDGVPTVITCLPLRYGHCAYSIAHEQDAQDLIDILVDVIKNLDINTYKDIIDFSK